MTYKEIINQKARLEKAKGASRKACANFHFILSLYHIDRGKSDVVPHFISRTKPMSYAKNLMLRVLTSFCKNLHRPPVMLSEVELFRRTISRSRSIPTRVPEAWGIFHSLSAVTS